MKRDVYPAYKDSGIEWLGEIPEHWKTKRIGHTTYVKGRIGWQGLTSDEFIDEGPYCVTGTDFVDGKIDWNTCYHVSEERYEEDPYIHLKEGDLLITKDGTIGKTAIIARLNNKATLNSGIFLTRPMKQAYNTSFMYWILNSRLFNDFIDIAKMGSTISHLYQNVFVRFFFPLPPHHEQQSIAAFLDKETSRIDELIAKKQRQIELLQEKRSALISHVVTKGLDPNVKMKDSGIEWLGEIPESWEIRRLRYLGYCQNGINIGAEKFGTGYPFVSYGDVYNNSALPVVGSGLVESSDADRTRYSVETGDVFFTRTSETIEEIGFSSVCLKTILDAVFAGFLIRFRPVGKTLNIGFSELYFRSDHLRAFFVKEMNLVTRASLSQDLLKEMPVLLPPIDEQRAIAAFLDRETARIDSMVNKVNESIDLLREYRTALISAAVTGKIDVREEALAS